MNWGFKSTLGRENHMCKRRVQRGIKEGPGVDEEGDITRVFIVQVHGSRAEFNGLYG